MDGTKKYRKAVIGTVSEYKTESEAQKAADALRLEVNEQTPRQMLKAISFETLVEHYRQHELPDILNGTRPLGSEAGDDELRKSYSTQVTYQGYLNKWILPRWRSYRLTDVKPVQVEQWLKSLPLSKGSKAKVRNIMSALYSHGQRWEWVSSNPIRHVRQSAKRSRIPTVLSPEQIKLFLEKLVDLPKTAVLLGASTGLRVGEILGLKWEDVDFETLELRVTRDVVKQRIERCKTEASRKPVPIGAEVAEILFAWRSRCAYNQPADWVFASPAKKGKQPYWPSSIYRVYLKPVLEDDLKITDPVGWHTLRHSLGTLMKANGEDVKTIQETLRHANFKVTMDVYTQAVTEVKRSAHNRVVRQIMGGGTHGEEE
ncbi:tyrosine-type recombinase/integrase [Terriglobus aquaticus]|nr:site-specific integrase [Terriglobus aquaticus]